MCSIKYTQQLYYHKNCLLSIVLLNNLFIPYLNKVLAFVYLYYLFIYLLLCINIIYNKKIEVTINCNIFYLNFFIVIFFSSF